MFAMLFLPRRAPEGLLKSSPSQDLGQMPAELGRGVDVAAWINIVGGGDLRRCPNGFRRGGLSGKRLRRLMGLHRPVTDAQEDHPGLPA